MQVGSPEPEPSPSPEQLADFLRTALHHLTTEQADYVSNIVLETEQAGVVGRQFRPFGCVDNARILAENPRISYVQGTDHDGAPHAWNMIDGVPFDITKPLDWGWHQWDGGGESFGDEFGFDADFISKRYSGKIMPPEDGGYEE